MTPKQARFCDEYVVDYCASDAVRRAGFADKNAKQMGHLLLKKPEIKVRIAELQAEQADRTRISADRVLAELARIGFANMKDFMAIGPDGDPVLDFSKLTREQAAALVEVTVEDFKDGRGEDAREVRRVKFKLADKRAALVDLGRHLGMFKDRVEITGKDGGAIQHEHIPADLSGASDDDIARVYAEAAGAIASATGQPKPTRH